MKRWLLALGALLVLSFAGADPDDDAGPVLTPVGVPTTPASS